MRVSSLRTACGSVRRCCLGLFAGRAPIPNSYDAGLFSVAMVLPSPEYHVRGSVSPAGTHFFPQRERIGGSSVVSVPFLLLRSVPAMGVPQFFVFCFSAPPPLHSHWKHTRVLAGVRLCQHTVLPGLKIQPRS